MSWFRLDDGFYSHPKVIDLSDDALALWFEVANWCSKHSPFGVVPRRLLVKVAPRSAKHYAEADAEAELEALAKQLVEATGHGLSDFGLWELHENGWQFHDWEVYQPDTVREATPKQKSEAGRLGGLKSAEARLARFGTSKPGASEAALPKQREAPSRPVPSRPEPEEEDPPPPVASGIEPDPEPAPQKLPLDFQLHPAAVADLARFTGQSEAVIRAAADEFKGYWTIGGGMGRKFPHWQAKCRDDIRRKHETGRLLAIAKRLGAAEDADTPTKLATLADIDRLLGADQPDPGLS